MAHRADISGRNISRLEAAYRLHAGRVYTLCLRLLADARLAEEATARIFVRLGREPSHTADEGRMRDLSIEESLSRLDMSGRDSDKRDAAITTTNVAVPSQAPLAAARLAALAARLPGRLRAAFVLRDVEGLSAAAVARHMRVEEWVAGGLIREARAELRRLYFGSEGR